MKSQLLIQVQYYLMVEIGKDIKLLKLASLEVLIGIKLLNIMVLFVGFILMICLQRKEVNNENICI
nr:MAG TPA: hypothetical protein [Caudoviricetes sp.]